MTTPFLATTDINTGDRVYMLGERKFIGVTSILSMLPKQRWLIPWAAKCTAERAVDYIHGVIEHPEDVSLDDTAAIKKWLALARLDELNEARDYGDKVHTLLEEVLEMNKPLRYLDLLWFNLSDEEQEEQKPYFQRAVHFISWLDQQEDAEVLQNEATVFNEELGYAGTCDLVLRMGDEIWYCDFKTGRGLHFDVALQLMAYRNGNLIYESQDIDGTILTAPMPHETPARKGKYKVRNVAVHLMKTKVKFVETQHNEKLWEIFKSLLTIKKEMGYTELSDVSEKIGEHKGPKIGES